MNFLKQTNAVAAHFYLVDWVEEIPTQEYNIRALRFLKAAEELYHLLDEFNSGDYAEEDVETEIQKIFYDVGKKHYGEEKSVLLQWFRDLYTLLRDQQQGPRIGTLVTLMGTDHFLAWLKERIENPFRFG